MCTKKSNHVYTLLNPETESGEHITFFLDNAQVSQAQDIWTNCTGNTNCTVDIFQNSTRALTNGFVTLTNLAPYGKNRCSLRGCSKEGCGEGVDMTIETHMSGKNLRTRGVIGVYFCCFCYLEERALVEVPRMIGQQAGQTHVKNTQLRIKSRLETQCTEETSYLGSGSGHACKFYSLCTVCNFELSGYATV